MNQHLLNLAVAEYEDDRQQECQSLCHLALEQEPDEESFLTLLAMSFRSSGQPLPAANVFRQLTVLHPQVAEYWGNLGLLLHELGDLKQAETTFRQALNLPHPVHDTLINFGLLLLDMGHVAEARHRFLDAAELVPSSAMARICAALACLECGDTRRAEALIPDPSGWPSLDLDLRRELVTALIQVGRIADAERVLEIDADTGDPAALAQLGALYERTNRVDDAAALLQRLQSHQANGNTSARIDALSLDAALAIRTKNHDRAVASTQAVLETVNLPLKTQASARFTLAKLADQRGDTSEAMTQLIAAHAINFQLASDMEPEIAASSEDPLRRGATFLSPQQACFAPADDDPDAAHSPVFIVGFPRSGTTMLEQMLDAHPGYVSMDERTVIQTCVEGMKAKSLQYPRQLNDIGAEDLADLRAKYWAESDAIVPRASNQILVDKNPLNMLRLPMIRRLFPNAKIIMALRHPCDVILSCYMQNFRAPAFMVLCSTLERLATSYANAMQFWIHHQPLLCPDVLLLRYEETVGDFPAQLVHIAEYLGIQDHRYLADFSAHAMRKGYISTPSYSQVIEPVSSRAVGRWESYRSYFEPVFDILRPVASHWGYSLEQA